MEIDKKEVTISYGWFESRKASKQHIRGDDGRSLCKLENGTQRPITWFKHADPLRPICAICKTLMRRPKRIPYRIGGSQDYFLRSREWKEIRYWALVKSGGKCMCCGNSAKNGAVLHVDHIKPRSKYPELALDLNNLQVLCGSCNQGKGHTDETDWR